MTVYVGSASIDENGRAHGGRAGNQTGRELKKQAWYLHSKGWRVFRARDGATAARIAACMKNAIANRHIGYDQYQRNSLYAAAKPLGFDVSKVTADCETDCSALVRVCCAYAGIQTLPPEFRTGNMPANLIATGRFVELMGDRYTRKSAYLRAGDILVTRTSGHTVVALNDGSRAEPFPEAEPLRPQGRVTFSGDCYVRAAPNTGGAILGVAKLGSLLDYAGETAENGWLKVLYKAGTGWVSGKYGRRVD